MDCTLPTYERCRAIASDSLEREIRMRWQNMSFSVSMEIPEQLAVLDELDTGEFDQGVVSFGNATILMELWNRVPEENEWMRDEIGLLLNAGGFEVVSGRLYQVAEFADVPGLLRRHMRQLNARR